MTRPYFNKDGTVCEDRLLRSGETVRIIHQCRSVGRPNKNKSLQNEMYRKLVKGEYEKSALDLCTYLDQVKCCPLDFMHWLFGGIVKAFWKRVLIPSKKNQQTALTLKKIFQCSTILEYIQANYSRLYSIGR